MGSGATSTKEAAIVGRILAQLGVHLLTGGGQGQMKEVAQAFTECRPRVGLSLAVLPSHPDDPRRSKSTSYPNEFVELPIRTHLSQSSTHVDSRNHINVLTSDALIFLWGCAGTLSEAVLARRYGVPRCLFLHPQTQSTSPLSPLYQEFQPEETFTNGAHVEGWIQSLLTPQ